MGYFGKFDDPSAWQVAICAPLLLSLLLVDELKTRKWPAVLRYPAAFSIGLVAIIPCLVAAPIFACINIFDREKKDEKEEAKKVLK